MSNKPFSEKSPLLPIAMIKPKAERTDREWLADSMAAFPSRSHSASLPKVRMPFYPDDRSFYDNQSDSEIPNRGSHDDFLRDETSANRILRTGRQRKKLAARSKGGEFQARRKKRRVYFACISKELDLQGLHDHFESKFTNKHADWYVCLSYYIYYCILLLLTQYSSGNTHFMVM
jgi:hypothetical protein